MKMALRWAVLVPAAVGMMLATCGPAGTAGAAGTMSFLSASARTVASGALDNHEITGVEDAIGCLTAHRCMAVGYRGGSAPSQVVLVVAGRQVRVSTVRSSSNLFAVSCPNRFGCWALGAPRIGRRNYVLVKISPAGTVRSVTRVRVQGGASLAAISCTTMTSCELFGTTLTPGYLNNWYFFAWSGKKLSQPYIDGVGYTGSYDAAGGISCRQAACVAVGTWIGAGSGRPTRDAIITTRNGVPGGIATPPGRGFSGVSCMSSSICYATTNDGLVVTLNDGVPGSMQNLPFGGSSIECAGAICWAAGLSGSNAEFVMMTGGVPVGSPVIDSALTIRHHALYPAIAKRGDGFAAVGAQANGKPRISEVVTN
jgi:hypothetical protein